MARIPTLEEIDNMSNDEMMNALMSILVSHILTPQNTEDGPNRKATKEIFYDVHPQFDEHDCEIFLRAVKNFPTVDFSNTILNMVDDHNYKNACYEDDRDVLTVYSARQLKADDACEYIINHELRHIQQIKEGKLILSGKMAVWFDGYTISHSQYVALSSSVTMKDVDSFKSYNDLPWERDANGFAMSHISDGPVKDSMMEEYSTAKILF